MKMQKKELEKKHTQFPLDVIPGSDGFFIVDKKWRCLYVSDNAFLAKRKEESFIGENIWNIFPTLKETDVYKNAVQTLKTGKKHTLEHQSSILPVCINISMYPVKEGIAVFFHDITKEKEIEEKLRESRYTYKLVVESSNDVITLLDMHGKIIYISPSAKKVFGYMQKELIGTNRLTEIRTQDQKKNPASTKKSAHGKKCVCTIQRKT